MKAKAMFRLIYLLCLLCYDVDNAIAYSLKGISAEPYGQPCNEHDDCTDFRLVCNEINRVCNCTRFYKWNNRTRECDLDSSELSAWLNDQSHATDSENAVEKDSHTLFYVQSIAGLLAIITLCIISLVIGSLAFCVFNDQDDVKKIITESEERSPDQSPSTSG